MSSDNDQGNYLAFGKPAFGEEEAAAVQAVLASGWVGMGPQVVAFESELADALESPHVLTVSSCSAALFLSLKALDVGPGDEVICPSFTWCSSANAALHLGAEVVFCDVDAGTLTLTPATVSACVTRRTKAVIAVHFGGLAVDVAELRRQLPAHVAIVEDAAHALGALFSDGTKVGSSGNPTCFSFYANKNLSTGEGGAVAIADPAAARRIASLRQHGLEADAWRRFVDRRVAVTGTEVIEIGYKMNYTDLQAAIGRVQLRRQQEFARTRLEIAQIYAREIPGLLPEITFQQEVTTERHARHLMTILLPRDALVGRDAMLAGFRKRGIGATLHYRPVHKMKPYVRPGVALPVTEDIAQRVLTLPISASMNEGDALRVVNALADILRTP